MIRNENLTKEDSNAIKGIAICMMLIHHLFYSLDFVIKMDIDFSLFTAYQANSIALFFKICVPIFVFISSYGITTKFVEQGINELNAKYFEKYAVKRYFYMMIPFWVVFILATIICNVVGIRSFHEIYGNGKMACIYIIIDFLGLANCFNTPILNVTWWYMSLAILLVFVMPFIYIIVKKFGWLSFIGAFLALQSIGWPGYGSYIIVAVLGVLACEKQMFKRINQKLCKTRSKNILMFIISMVIIAACCIVFIKAGYTEIIFCITTVVVVFIYKQYISFIKPIRILLMFLGRHSMNIFLTHTFIFAYFFKEFIYSWHYSSIIFLVLLCISLICSYALIFVDKIFKVDFLKKQIVLKVNSFFYEEEGE